MSLISELKRRNVIRVTIFYVVSAWLLLQIADLIFELLLVPNWTLRFIFGLLVAAFPFVIGFAWAFEITPEGIKRESDIVHSPENDARTHRKLNRLTIGALLVLVAFLVTDRLVDKSPESAMDRPPEQAIATSAAEVAPNPKPGPGQATAANTVAVLPFVNMSGDPDNEYFSDGLSETLLHLLARIPQLQVAARTSSFKFKGMNEDIREIGEQLNVAHVLEGSVQRVGDRVRITAQLIKAEDGYHLWSETFDRTLDDVFAVQDEIALSVTEALKLTLLDDAPTSKVVATEVFDDFLKAQGLLSRGSTQDIGRAIDILETVVEREPDFALAHARLALAYRAHSRSGALLEDVIPKAAAAAERAIVADPTLADGYLMRGQFMALRGQDEEARQQFESALELNPNDAETLMSYAEGLARMGEFEPAWNAAQEAAVLDPLNPDTQQILAEVLGRSGRRDEAIDILNTALQSWPRNLKLLAGLRDTFFYSGQYGRALDVAGEITELDPASFSNWQAVYEIYMDLGATAEAQEAVERMSELAPERAYDEVAVLELLKGNVEGYREYLRHYNETRTWSREYRMIQLAVSEQRYTDALLLIEEELEQKNANPRWFLSQAAVAFLAGQADLQSKALTRVDQALEAFDFQSIQERDREFLSALRAAAAADSQTAVTHLRRAIDAGSRDFDGLLSGDQFIWLPIRNTPEFQALIAEIQERNEATLEEIRATTH